jgi:hypothetical protein
MTDDPSSVETWKAHTSAFDRVQAIALTLNQPRPASYIGSEAHVAENTARTHLERLVDLNVLLKYDVDGTTRYAPDPLHTRMAAIRDLLNEHDYDELIDLKAELQEQLDTWQNKYDVDSPDELHECAVETNHAEATSNIAKTVSDWRHVLYRLSLVDETIKNYRTYSCDHIEST